MSYASAEITNSVILLGSGMELTDDGTVQPTQTGIERADRFLQYYADNKDAFGSEDASVICSGGYGLLTAGVERPNDENMREGIATADYLVRNNVPHQLIRIEKESISTLTNLTNSIDMGYIAPEAYSSERKLGIVSHPNHLKRAALIAGKLGMPKEALALIETVEQDSAAKEFVLRSAYRALFTGAHGSKELQKREQLPKAVLGAIRRT